MTENEVINYLQDMITEGQYCGDEIVARDDENVLKFAISSLEEIQQYRALGTVEELKEILVVISDGYDDVDENGISTGLLYTLLQYANYAKLGTVEELREAAEKQTLKKPNIWGDGYDDKGNIIYDMYDCPCCDKSYEIDYEKYDFCPNCGQAIDWSEEEELLPD